MLSETVVSRGWRRTPQLSKLLRTAVISVLCGVCVTMFPVTQGFAEAASVQVPIAKGVLLVAHPSMEDPNFRQTVVLIVEHGPEGTIGFVLNRPTDILLSQTLPNVEALRGTSHRLFVGGPVSANRMTMLVQLTNPLPGLKSVVDGIYAGGTPEMLERFIADPKPAEAFRVFAGMAGWAPGQLAFELRQGAWATLQPDTAGIFETDPASLWPDSLQRLQAPMTISH